MAATKLTSPAPPYSKEDDTADFGDFVSTEDEEMDIEETAEPWHKYDIQKTSHVYYPICLGEMLNERYLVEHKLGRGGFSTVWMAYDLQDKRDVALKVMSPGDWGEREIRVQDEIVRNVRDSSHLVMYLTSFLLSDEKYRRYTVLVFPLLGPCLNPLMLREMSMATRMSAARQLLEALENLHNAGIVHRDLNDRNCMLGVVPLHLLNRRAKYEALGRPLKQAIPFVPDLWKQGELVGPVKIPENLRTEKFYLGDFSLTMKLGDPVVQKGYPPILFCSPDRFHGKHPSFACDMWSYMIIFAELYLGYPPFANWPKGGVMSSFVSCLGPLPEPWKDLYTPPERDDSWYDQNRAPNLDFALSSIINRFRPDADPVEKSLVECIMRNIFTYDIDKRLTATQLLRDPSFRALMDRYGC